jgi:hypothetical protein
MSRPPVTDHQAVLAGLASRQHGLVTRQQLVGAGVTGSRISRWARRGQLHRIHRGVYALGHARLSQGGRWLAGVLAVGADAVLGHFACARLFGASRFPVPYVDVVATVQRRLASREVRCHQVRRLAPQDVTVHRGIPATSLSRTLLDLSGALTRFQVANVIHRAAYRGHFSAAGAADVLARAVGHPHRSTLEAALTLYASGSAGTRSAPEDRFVELLAEERFPEPLVNVHLHGYEVDAHWPAWRLAVEIDGPHHARPSQRRGDGQRDAVLAAAGYTVLRFSDLAIERGPSEVMRTLRLHRP